MEPYKAFYLGPFVQERTMAHLALTRAFLQPAAIATMHSHPEGDTHPPPLVLNLFSKQVEPTVNMRPNLDENYSRHWLIGASQMPQVANTSLILQVKGR